MEEVFIFWSGGLDSTFLVCKYHFEGYKVQTIYIKNCDPRQNIEAELVTMKKIANLLGINAPLIIDASTLRLDKDIIRESKYWFERGIFTRYVNQFSFMVQISRNLCKKIKVGSITEPSGVIYKISPNNLHSVFNTLEYPILFYTKQNLINSARLRGFLNILRVTISCWFPIKYGNKFYPCGECQMCLARPHL